MASVVRSEPYSTQIQPVPLSDSVFILNVFEARVASEFLDGTRSSLTLVEPPSV